MTEEDDTNDENNEQDDCNNVDVEVANVWNFKCV